MKTILIRVYEMGRERAGDLYGVAMGRGHKIIHGAAERIESMHQSVLFDKGQEVFELGVRVRVGRV